MKYELWCGDILLGHSELTFWQMTATTFAGDFDPVPGREEQLARIAIGVHCLRSWMDRDARDGLGRHVVKASFRNSRLFTAIAEIVAARHDPAIQLRRPDGTVIRTRHLIIQDLDTLPELSELVDEAICGDDEGDEDAEPDFFDTPEGREVLRAMDEDGDTELSEMLAEEAWRGDVHPDESICEDEAWMARYGPRRPLVRFNLHVKIEHEGDIPADTSWLLG